MPGIRRFEELTCWKEARALSRAIDLWLATSTISDQSYIDQLRRASVSVQLNIAEGFDRFTHNDFHRFLRIAKASLSEVRALLIIGFDRGFPDAATHASLADQAELLAKRLARLMSYLRTSKPR